MNDFEILQKSMESFTRATASLEQAYANLEGKFTRINRELEIKNQELERTIAEKEDMKNYLHSILESLTNGVIVTDGSGKIRGMNKYASLLTGMGEEAAHGKRIDLLWEDPKPEHRGDLSLPDCFQGERGKKIRLKGRTLEIISSPFQAGKGETSGAVFILRDITQIEKLEDMAKRREKFAAMGEMAANIAHEIRNPLGSIELFASLLMKNLSEQRDKDRAARIIASVRNMDNKISNLLLFTKDIIPCLKCVDINSLVRETLQFAEQLASQGNITMHCGNLDREVLVRGDAEMLKQVFLNLILNAFQAMPEGGRLHIETHCTEADKSGLAGPPYWEILFADNGDGIVEENLKKIFDPFFSTREGTSGLGLAIVHNIIDMHKGLIHVEKGEQGGTVFTVLLPLWDEGDSLTDNILTKTEKMSNL